MSVSLVKLKSEWIASTAATASAGASITILFDLFSRTSINVPEQPSPASPRSLHFLRFSLQNSIHPIRSRPFFHIYCIYIYFFFGFIFQTESCHQSISTPGLCPLLTNHPLLLQSFKSAPYPLPFVSGLPDYWKIVLNSSVRGGIDSLLA